MLKRLLAFISSLFAETETVAEILTPPEAKPKVQLVPPPLPVAPSAAPAAPAAAVKPKRAQQPNSGVRVTSKECYARFGDPTKETSMTLWDVPPALEIGALPNRIYCNKLMVDPLARAFQNIIDRGLIDQVRTWDGCFNIRRKKGGSTSSLHSWGIAIDLNAAWNGFRKKPTMSKELVACFTDEGFMWGGEWSTPDGMHFQLKYFP